MHSSDLVLSIATCADITYLLQRLLSIQSLEMCDCSLCACAFDHYWAADFKVAMTVCIVDLSKPSTFSARSSA